MQKIIYVDMDNVLVDFQSGIDKLDEETLKKYEGNLDEVPGIFGLMQPMKDSIEVYHQLSEKYDVYILSTAPWNNPSAWSDKLEWVKKHLPEKAHKRLILSHHKHLSAGDYLIDDREKNGAIDFKGELIRFGSEKFKNWIDVREYLLNGESE